MFDLVLHFIATDFEMHAALSQVQHLVGVYDTIEDCDAAKNDWPEGVQFMAEQIYKRMLSEPDVSHVVMVVMCTETVEAVS